MELSPLEVVAALLGLANVALLWRRSIWNYPFGMAMVALYMEIFWEARLYAEAGLQVFFFAVNNYGWVLWLRNGGAEGPVTVGWMTARQRQAWAGGIVALSLSLGWLLHRYTNAALPYVDATVAAASIAAQFMLSFRKNELGALDRHRCGVHRPLHKPRAVPHGGALCRVARPLGAGPARLDARAS